MENKQFDALYMERLNSLSPYIRSIPDDDLRQEAYIGIFEALKNDINATDRYLKNRAMWKQGTALRKGRSVDNGFHRRDELEIVHYDQLTYYDNLFSQVIHENRSVSLDDLVMDKISLESLIEDMTRHEMDIFQYKVVDEMFDKDIRAKLGVDNQRYNQIKEAIREKIGKAFSE